MVFVKQALARVQSYFKNYDTEQPAEILADILHYCRENDIDFDEELDRAYGYVNEELSVDDECA